MAEKNETAEQKLLKIIESPAVPQPTAPAEGDAVAKEVANAVKSTGLPNISFLSAFGPFANFVKEKLPFVSGVVAFGPREVNRILFFAIGLLIVAFFFNVVSGIQLLAKRVHFSIEAKPLSGDLNFIPQVKAIRDYLGSIERRNIFQPYEKKEEEVQVQQPTGESVQLSVLAKSLKLVGISWSDSAESACAMIEDVKSGITKFTKEGETVNGVTIKHIYVDRITVSFQDEELTIKL